MSVAETQIGRFLTNVLNRCMPVIPSLFQRGQEDDLQRNRNIVSPWTILESNDLDDCRVADCIRESFKPQFIFLAGLVVPLPDLPDDSFICYSKDGGREPSLWLDPEIWGTTVVDFNKFVQEVSSQDKELRHYVVSHETQSCDLPESILLVPVVDVDSSSDQYLLGSNWRYSLQSDGRLCLGNTNVYYDLGYLDPQRLIQDELKRWNQELLKLV